MLAPAGMPDPRRSAPALALLLTGLLLLPGCAPKQVQPLQGQALRFRASLEARVQTSTRRLSQANPPQPDPVAEALAGLAHTGLDLDLVLRLEPSREFPDGSLGWLVHFEQVQGRALALGPAQEELAVRGPASGWELQGRSVELRTFPDGEVLAVDLAEHILGEGRPGELLDLLFIALSPFPPELEVGARARRTSRWPLTLGGPRGWRHALFATWTNHGQVPEAAGVQGQPWRLTYQGPTEARGVDPQASPPVGVRSHGQLSGELWLTDVDTDPLPLRVLRHGLSWTRDNEIEYPAAVGGPVRVLQHQVLALELERLPAAGEAP